MLEVSSKRTFPIGGEDKELFISFATQQNLIGMVGSIEHIGQFLTDINLQTNALALVIFGKEYRTFKDTQELFDALDRVALDPETANGIVHWIQDYLINFTQAQAKALSEKYSSQIALTEKTNDK